MSDAAADATPEEFPAAAGMLELREDADFYFDAEAAERPVRFIEKFCRHYEGVHAGKPFILHPLQKRIVRDLFGWKWRLNGVRRFNDCYYEGAVGCGKSPLLAGIGLYGLIADGEAGAQVYSLASNYGQARVVFDCAKRFASQSDPLRSVLEILEYEIRYPAAKSFWKIVSGKGPGAGCRPHIILGDEAHEWPGPGAYKDLRDRMAKRRQPLLIVATNAGRSQASFCWTLRERALAALAGAEGTKSLYPIIWSADDDARTDDPQAWREANPLLGITVSETKVRDNCAEAVAEGPVEEADFRRLYLGIWPTVAGDRWLDLADWDACCAVTRPPPAAAPLYVGLDLSAGDDLCAAGRVWPTPERFHLACKFWVPRATAEKYEERHGIPYSKWAAAGHITLLDEPTISDAAREAIAKEVIGWKAAHPIKAVCYDRYRADKTVAVLEAAALTCVPIAQGYSVSPGCFELSRRLKERSAAIEENPVLRFCAENTEVKQDDRGNIWPIKPGAKGRYAGRRGAKIDGISALVTALTEARKHAFPAAKKYWGGTICKV